MSSDQTQGPADSIALSNMKVLVTRPRDQAEPLCMLIESAGGVAIRFPVIEILPVVNRNTQPVSIPQDIVIYTSVNAVRYGASILLDRQDSSRLPQIIAIGQATARALSQLGVTVDLLPVNESSSEHLLSMPQMQDVSAKYVTIIKGEGGRELLADTLAARGAQVSTLNVYRRGLPDVNADSVLRICHEGILDAVVVTSIEGLSNLFMLLDEKGKACLQSTSFVVISERIKKVCAAYQISAPVIVSAGASDNAIIEALVRLSGKNHSEVDDD